MEIDAQGLEGKPLPNWVKHMFINRLGKFLTVQNQKRSQDVIQKVMVIITHMHVVKRLQKFLPRVFMLYFVQDSETIETSLTPMSASSDEEKILKTIIDQIISFVLCSLTHQKLAKENHQRIRHEWSLLCIVLDRICLIGFLCFSIGFTLILFTIK